MENEESKAAAILGRKGGEARAENLSPKERKAIAKKAAAARWAGHKAKRPSSARKNKGEE
jgi:hypothetical protein